MDFYIVTIVTTQISLLALLVGRKFIVCIRRSSYHPTNVTIHPPRPFISVIPIEKVSSKVDLEFATTFNADGGKYIMVLTRQVDPIECRRKTHAIIGVEENPIPKFVTATDRVTRINAGQGIGVVATACGVFKEFT
jgi:hypothetical protein